MESLEMQKTMFSCLASTSKKLISRPKTDLRNLARCTVKGSGIALDLVKLFGGKSSVIRKRKEWDLYEPIVDLLSNEEVETLNAREERNARNIHESETESETEIRIPSLIPFLIRDGIRDGIRNGLSCIPSLIRLRFRF
ncbi:hypothetical protein Syun_020782 [Stephania yunnanensis]|uniref:Uncharacterized protein n=1 Tax=Stephania yunnanensis TaxID=152371 RepID=A0AAP0IF37_9MAGN